MAKNIWVFCEQRDGDIQNVSLELIGVARELAETTKEKVCAMLIGHNVTDKASDLIAHGADEVDVVDSEHLSHFVTEPYAQAVTHLSRKYEPSEIRMLIDGVLASRHVSANHSRDLIEKLASEETVDVSMSSTPPN